MSCSPDTSAESLVCVQDFADHARQVLPKFVHDYYSGGACDQTTLRNNTDAFKRLRIRPRCLIDVTSQDTKTKVIGKEIKIPLGVSPTAYQKLAHPDGEIGIARAIGTVGGIYILSSGSTTSLEDVRAGAPNTTLWFQLVLYKDREIIRQLVKRAESAGYEALVLTVDMVVFGVRYDNEKNNFDLPLHLKLANFPSRKHELNNDVSDIKDRDDLELGSCVSWNDVTWLKSITKLPVILKGILTAEDAELAVKYGVNAIIVSNHGGRHLDGVPASIEALPEIVEAVNNKIDVYFDGGIRFGTDIFKALALGAKMVFVGRPVLWGLAHSGQVGVKRVLDILLGEFRTAMALAGCQKLDAMKKSMVVHESYYFRT